MRRELPKTTRISFRGLDPQLTDEELAEFFKAMNLDIPLENISSERPGSKLVAVPQQTIADLLAWAFGENKLRGRTLNPQPFVKFVSNTRTQR